MEIPKQLKDEIWDYCRINDISNIDEFIVKLIKQGFTVEKFGATPVGKVVEKIVEVPVEKIIEKIVEVPMQMVDNEISNKYTEISKELIDAKAKIELLNGQLEIEKNKNKKDLYGEK